jgi:hypothetical protein
MAKAKTKTAEPAKKPAAKSKTVAKPKAPYGSRLKKAC